MHACSGVSKPHCFGAGSCHCWRRQHDGRVCRLRLVFFAQVREEIVERCVAVCDQGYKHEPEAAHCQSAW
eukprot:3648513-Pleurochrysis_carterae.AAC.2